MKKMSTSLGTRRPENVDGDNRIKFLIVRF